MAVTTGPQGVRHNWLVEEGDREGWNNYPSRDNQGHDEEDEQQAWITSVLTVAHWNAEGGSLGLGLRAVLYCMMPDDLSRGPDE